MSGSTFRVISSPGPDPRASSPLFVLVHGIGMSHRYVARLHEALSRASAVASVDLPGFAALPKPDADLGVAEMADALAMLVARLADRPVVLIGHSMGAQWAVETARRHPALVAHVVMIGPVADAAHRSVRAQCLALALDSLFESPRANAIVFSDYLRCGAPWYFTQLRHMLSYRIESAVTRLTVPCLVIRGGRDPVAGREWCRRLRDATPRGVLVEVPGRHHLVQESAPDAVADAILAHVTAPLPRLGTA